jgi:ribosome-associated translation inhibitor RaiA
MCHHKAYLQVTFNRWRFAMQVFFTSRDADGNELRDAAVRRVRFVMRRLTWLVPRASVQLADVNGPRGGVDKRCQVQFKTDGGANVVITAMARDWREALDSALARASRALLRLWRRGHVQRPQARRALAFDR